MNIAIYIRVSTKEQNLDLQRTELLEFCASKKWGNITFYEDKGVSGGKQDRPALNRLMSDITEGKVNVLLIWKIDRLFRSLKHLVLTVEDLEQHGTKLISLRDNLDFTTSAGRLMFHVVGAFAQFERDIIRERVTAGMKAAKARGSKIGRPKVRDSAQIQTLKQAGLSLRQIAKKLNTSLGSVQRALAEI